MINESQAPENIDFEAIYAGLPDHVKKVLTLDELKRTAENGGPWVPFEDVVAEIERAQQDFDRKRHAG